MGARVACAVLAGALAVGCTHHVAAPAAANEPGRRLHAIFDAEWNHTSLRHPVWVAEMGDPRTPRRWGDVGLAAQARREAHDRDVLAELGRIDRSALSPEDALSYDLFRYDYESAVAGQRYRLYLLAVNQRGGIQTADERAGTWAFDRAQDFADWNARLRDLPRYMDDTIELLREGARIGMTHPRVAMERVLAQLDKQIVADPTESPFYAPYAHVRGELTDEERRRLSADAAEAIRTAVVPAYRKLRAFWTETYLPACKEDVGAWQLPDGAALYAYLVRTYTTTSLGPDEVHAIGLREVARIRAEMEATKRKIGFPGALSELFHAMRTESRFFYATRDELLVGYRELTKRIDPMLVRLFRTLPRTPYGVEPIPDHFAPDTTTAYYRQPAYDGSRAATFMVNLYRPETRPKWEMPALTLHEAVPGHHLQIALALEHEGLPDFRRNADYTAFLEGWALYAESLGDELGIYDDPFAKMGQLTYEMWRAARLVVDTGIHHLRWDRQRALEYLLENTALTRPDLENEVDRYVVWPGQAVAYKIGELTIKRLRAHERAALGDRFDVRDFHDRVLRAGPLPLEILEREVGRSR